MMTLEEMREGKAQLHWTNEQLSERSGVPLGTVQKIMAGITASPRYDTLLAMEKALQEGGVFLDSLWSLPGAEQSFFREQAISYDVGERWPRQGSYTVKDLEALPNDVRVELIDGMIYDMATPSTAHQVICFQLAMQFENCVRECHKDCMVFVAPGAVWVDRSICTEVQPDIYIVCDRNQIRKKGVWGAPDLVVEVLSPSTRSKDMHRKWTKYRDSGVREYWIVDPKNKKVFQVLWGEGQGENRDEDIVLHSFESDIPIGISGGRCTVHFAAIYDSVRFLHPEE